MAWDRLFADFDAYLRAQSQMPYDPDRVQALGMRFAVEWNQAKIPICDLLGEDPDEFNYTKWRFWVPRVRALLGGTGEQNPATQA